MRFVLLISVLMSSFAMAQTVNCDSEQARLIVKDFKELCVDYGYSDDTKCADARIELLNFKIAMNESSLKTTKDEQELEVLQSDIQQLYSIRGNYQIFKACK